MEYLVNSQKTIDKSYIFAIIYLEKLKTTDMKNLFFAILAVASISLFASCEASNDPGYDGPSQCNTCGGGNGNVGGGNWGNGGGGTTPPPVIVPNVIDWSAGGYLLGKITSFSSIPVDYTGDYLPDNVDVDGDGYMDPLQTAVNSAAFNDINYYFQHFHEKPENNGYDPVVIVYPSWVYNSVQGRYALFIGSYWLGRE